MLPRLGTSARCSRRELVTNEALRPLAVLWSGRTAVQDADELRSVILKDPGTPGILLRAYDDLRGRISTSREALMNELSERVVNDLTK